MIYLTIKRAAEYIGVSRSTIYRWMYHSDDPLPYQRYGKRSYRIIQIVLDKYLERRFGRNAQLMKVYKEKIKRLV